MSTLSEDKLALALAHLVRVVAAARGPIDWADLALYGFFGLENAVDAAALHAGLTTSKAHPVRVELARTLHASHGLPDVATLLIDLNEARKAAAYGEPMPTLDAAVVVAEIEAYVAAVATLVGGGTGSG